MTDLISRAAAIDELMQMVKRHEHEIFRGELLHYTGIKAMLGSLPAVDAAPMVHARWTTKRTWKHDGEWYCSACEYEPVVFMDSAFCPNCGAKMDEEE